MQLTQSNEDCNLTKSTEMAANRINLSYEVIIPCLNGEATIERSIVSAFSQSNPPRQVTVHDNYSSDSSVRIVQSLTKKYRKLHIVRHDERVSAMRSYKRSLENVQGRVLFLAADDILAKDGIERLLQVSNCRNMYHSVVPQ